MDGTVGLLLLVVLSGSLACDARQLAAPELSTSSLVISDISVVQVNKKEDVCTLCEQFTAQALDYLAENKTQKEIIEMLHLTCSRVPPFKKECVTLVDYYTPLFFLEVSSVQPGEFCRKVNLCQETVITSDFQEDSCAFCHHALSEVLVKLKDPDTQLDIIEFLLKGCNSMENYEKKCKRLVFEYGPLILVDVEKYLETTDVCTVLHACDLPAASGKQASPAVLSDS